MRLNKLQNTQKKQLDNLSKIHEASALVKYLKKDYNFYAFPNKDRGQLQIFKVINTGEDLRISEGDFNHEYNKLKREFDFATTYNGFINNKTNEIKTERKSNRLITVSARKERISQIQEFTKEARKMIFNLDEYIKELDKKGFRGEYKHSN